MLFSVGLIFGRFFVVVVVVYSHDIDPLLKRRANKSRRLFATLTDVCQVHCVTVGGTRFQQWRISGSLRCFTALVQIFRPRGKRANCSALTR